MTGFREGWASKAPRGAKAHYFRRVDVGLARSLCGAQDAPAGWLNDPGHSERCSRCAALVAREVAKSDAVPAEAGKDERGDHRTCEGKACD
ncbi:hypothetical protein [Mesorhizobium sp. M0058]|uniref:hypothetical protein n=1 Tax=Mesorhizobium sp. M0058 TaxID=2956865 RepID=UPI003339C786